VGSLLIVYQTDFCDGMPEPSARHAGSGKNNFFHRRVVMSDPAGLRAIGFALSAVTAVVGLIALTSVMANLGMP
jgi:hypothetical protein